MAQVCRLWEIPRNRHYVDGWVMWPAGRFRWWAWRWGRFRPHNPGVVRVNGRLVGVSDRIRAFLPDAGFLARSSVGGRLLTP